MITPNTIWFIVYFIVICLTLKLMFNVGMIILFNLLGSELLSFMDAMGYEMDIKSLALSLLGCIFLFIMYLRGSYLNVQFRRNNP